jgi:hypothetical protein
MLESRSGGWSVPSSAAGAAVVPQDELDSEGPLARRQRLLDARLGLGLGRAILPRRAGPGLGNPGTVGCGGIGNPLSRAGPIRTVTGPPPTSGAVPEVDHHAGWAASPASCQPPSQTHTWAQRN